MKYKFLEHTADVKFRAYGYSVEEAFLNSALAMNETIKGKIKIGEKIKKKIISEGRDLPSLLYNFLEEFLYLLDARGFLMSRIESIKINLRRFTLEAEVSGDYSKNYKFSNNVKAVTYNEMFVRKEKNEWICQAVLDV